MVALSDGLEFELDLSGYESSEHLWRCIQARLERWPPAYEEGPDGDIYLLPAGGHLGGGEREDRARLEAVVDRGLAAFLEVGTALTEIRDRRLYRDTHDTFENYCREHWRIGASRARQLISAAEAAANVESVT